MRKSLFFIVGSVLCRKKLMENEVNIKRQATGGEQGSKFYFFTVLVCKEKTKRPERIISLGPSAETTTTKGKS